MPYVCRSCSFFDGDGAHASTCPTCGGAMQFTMLDPHGAATATATLEPPANAKPEWHNEYKFGYEEVEAPGSFATRRSASAFRATSSCRAWRFR